MACRTYTGYGCTIHLVNDVRDKVVYQAHLPYPADDDSDVKAALSDAIREVGSQTASATSNFATDEYPISSPAPSSKSTYYRKPTQNLRRAKRKPTAAKQEERLGQHEPLLTFQFDSPPATTVNYYFIRASETLSLRLPCPPLFDTPERDVQLPEQKP
ncbi:hypothetical protein SISNIDRAFT_469346 [Sistotremastrum niveocremeum HHB9708]|uniref:Uncharacterized protein n=1 Tax=Sistotremastrum niveocremeum HHB9708 TaxID=1314777 RepID=A0A164Q3P4_9AGAM|nr:hypothetical protein SISNIDRAFT_469346 [Sistotremastrum niveocremeum HHB9708]